MFSLLTNNKIFDIIGSSKHLNAFVRGNKFRRIGFQRALGRCESVTSAENNSSPEQFRRKTVSVGGNGFLPLQRIRVENDAGKRITFRCQKEWYRGVVITSSLLQRIFSRKGDFSFCK